MALFSRPKLTLRKPVFVSSRRKLKDTKNVLELIETMTERHNPTYDLLCDILAHSEERFYITVKNLNDMNMRGVQIDIARSKFKDISYFIEAVEERDQRMIDFVNENYANSSIEKACHRGAAELAHI